MPVSDGNVVGTGEKQIWRCQLGAYFSPAPPCGYWGPWELRVEMLLISRSCRSTPLQMLKLKTSNTKVVWNCKMKLVLEENFKWLTVYGELDKICLKKTQKKHEKEL
jgi:hypothetical protein